MIIQLFVIQMEGMNLNDISRETIELFHDALPARVISIGRSKLTV